MVTKFPCTKVQPFVRAELDRLIAERTIIVGEQNSRTSSCTEILAEKLRISKKTLNRILTSVKYKNSVSVLTLDSADRVAIGLGYHIGDIWPEYWDE